MIEIENNDLDEGVVVQEIQTGYTMYNRIAKTSNGWSVKKNFKKLLKMSLTKN